MITPKTIPRVDGPDHHSPSKRPKTLNKGLRGRNKANEKRARIFIKNSGVYSLNQVKSTELINTITVKAAGTIQGSFFFIIVLLYLICFSFDRIPLQ